MLSKMREHPERPDFKKLSFEAKIEAKRGLGARLHILQGAMNKTLLEGAGGAEQGRQGGRGVGFWHRAAEGRLEGRAREEASANSRTGWGAEGTWRQRQDSHLDRLLMTCICPTWTSERPLAKRVVTLVQGFIKLCPH